MTNIYELHFPGELAGVDIDAVDVHMLALDALRLLSYFARESDFTPEQYRFLLEIKADLPKVIKGVEAKHKKYFEAIQKSVEEALNVHHRTGKEPS